MLDSKALLDSIRQAKNIADVCGALDLLSVVIRRQVETQPMVLNDARSLATQISEIRSMLMELERSGIKVCEGEGSIPQRYLELEGKIKEIRNDLDRIQK